MSKTADYDIQRIEELANETGYDFNFLFEKYAETMRDGNTFEYFETVTLEKDW